MLWLGATMELTRSGCCFSNVADWKTLHLKPFKTVDSPSKIHKKKNFPLPATFDYQRVQLITYNPLIVGKKTVEYSITITY